MNARRVGIVVLHWGDPVDTQNLLASLKKISYSPVKVYLVDQTLSLNIKLPSWVELIRPTSNRGYAAGNNLGIKRALEERCYYILLLNNDTLVKSDFLDFLVGALEENSKAAAAAPTITYALPEDLVWYAGGRLDLHRGESWHLGSGHNGKQLYLKDIPETSAQKTSFTTGCCVLIRPKAIDEVGLLMEDYFLYWEDTDWCARATQKNWLLLYVPRAHIIHKISSSLGVNSPSYWYYNFRNRLLFIRRFVSWPWKLWAWILLGVSITKEVIKLFTHYRKNHGEYISNLFRAFKDNFHRKYGQL